MKYLFILSLLISTGASAQKIGAIRYDPVYFRVLDEAKDGGLPYATDSLVKGFNKQMYKHWFTGDEWITVAYLDNSYKPLPNNRQWWFCFARFDERIKSDTVFGKLTIVVFTDHGDSLRNKNVYMITQNSERYYLDEYKKPFKLAEKEIGDGSEYFRSFVPATK